MGVPIRAVTAPIGISDDTPITIGTAWDNTSQKTRKTPPHKKENTPIFLKEGGIIFLRIWGITIPTKLITPVWDTIMEVTREARIKRVIFILPVLTPRFEAKWSPR